MIIVLRISKIQKSTIKSNDLKYRFVDPHPFVPADDEKRKERCRKFFPFRQPVLLKGIEYVGSSGAVIGISGGLDSTLALLAAVGSNEASVKTNTLIFSV